MVPHERRRTYAHSSDGYIRLAADLCKLDSQMDHAGSLGPGLALLEDYYRDRLKEDQQVVEAVALLHRVGWEDDVAEQLECLAELTGVDPASIRNAASRLKDAPGFLASTPRYVYVTPQIIAEIAFQHAWTRWAEPNPRKFLDRIPQLLLSSFELRVRGLANQEVRSFVSAHFWKRVADLVPTDLADENKVDQLLGLLETDPTTYLPQLERLVREASNEQLLAIKGSEFGGTGVRRSIVWAAERLAPFPEYFPSAELILRKLALAETEPGIGNNATGIWRQLFRVYLPGTAVPFLDRFPLFREVVLSSDPTERDLALGGLDHLMVAHVTRMSSPSLVGGRIPPADWTPKTQEEWDACLSAGMALIQELLSKDDPLASAAWNYLIVHLRALLSWGQLDRLGSILEKHRMSEALLAPWLEQIDDYLQYECGKGANPAPAFVEYCQRVRDWRKDLIPKDFAGRLRSVVGKDVWHHGIRENVHSQGSEIEPLVDEMVTNPSLLESTVGYLCSEEARSASSLGFSLGQKDSNAAFFDVILAGSRRSRSSALIRGYVGSLLNSSPAQQSLINATLDRLEDEDPEMAAEIIVAGLEVTDPITRLVRLVATGKLSPGYLQYLHYGNVLNSASTEQFAAALRVLAPPGCPVAQLKQATEFIGSRLKAQVARGEPPKEDAATLSTIKGTLERSAKIDDGSGFWWKESLSLLSETEPEWTASVAASSIAGEDLKKSDYATSVLAKLAARHSQIVMKIIGEAILDPDQGWRWLIGPRRGIFTSLPVDVILDWLGDAGVEGARAIAYHLPSPSVTADGKPVVPELTEQVLSAYGEDERVFDRFSTGRHDLQVFSGEISSQHEAHARTAKAFLNHSEPVIRRWAKRELASSEATAAEWRKKEEDERFEP